VTTSLQRLLAEEDVPYLAAHRYTDSGLRKRAAWEDTWRLQRREDAGEILDAPIPVPPKYASADFVRKKYWAHRGELDVPKERFVLYPDAGRDTDPTAILGWAGWDHASRPWPSPSSASSARQRGGATSACFRWSPGSPSRSRGSNSGTPSPSHSSASPPPSSSESSSTHAPGRSAPPSTSSRLAADPGPTRPQPPAPGRMGRRRLYPGRRRFAVGMNIKNAETERLTRELAEATGESLTTALTLAVRERLDRVRAADRPASHEQTAERILALGAEIASRLRGPYATQDHGDLLYDERGLPA
jgi:hypothetical protein